MFVTNTGDKMKLSTSTAMMAFLFIVFVEAIVKIIEILSNNWGY